MADINALIAQGVTPIQIENPLNQMGKIMSIRNAQQEYSMNEQKLAEQNALRDFLKGNPDLTDANTLGRLTTGFGASGLAYGTKLQELAKAKGEEKAKQWKLIEDKTGYFRNALSNVNTPDDARVWTAAVYSDPDLGPVFRGMGTTAEQAIAKVPTDPAAFNNWKQQAAVGATKFMELNKPHFVTQDLGGKTQVMSMPGMGGAASVVPGTVQAKTLTPGEARTAAQEGKAVAHTIMDEAGNVTLLNKFGQVVTPTAGSKAATLKGKPSATFEKTKNQREQLNRDLTMTISELKDITKDGGLIDQSTGSGAGRAVDVAAGFFGSATKGAVAAAKLKPIADLALKMVPRFEGPQSDKDTQSYKEAAGQLADSSLPSKIRKEAGKTVLRLMENRKGQFVTKDMANEGTAASGGVDANNPLLK